jgi:hypothetical protein
LGAFDHTFSDPEEFVMPFQPQSLDSASLKRLSHRLQEALAADTPEGQPTPTLSRTQEILARTLSFQNWNDALHQTAKNDRTLSPLAAQVTRHSSGETLDVQANMAHVLDVWSSIPSHDQSIEALESACIPFFKAFASSSPAVPGSALQLLSRNLTVRTADNWSSEMTQDWFIHLMKAMKAFWNYNIDQDWWPKDSDHKDYWHMLVHVLSSAELFNDDRLRGKQTPPPSLLNFDLVTHADPHRIKQAWMACFAEDPKMATQAYLVQSNSMEEMVHRVRTLRDLLPHLSVGVPTRSVSSSNLTSTLISAWRQALPDTWPQAQDVAFEVFMAEKGAVNLTILLPQHRPEPSTPETVTPSAPRRRRTP